MNQDIKQRWVAALRSDEYEQGTDYLCEAGKFCCLGVLSDLAVKDGAIEAPQQIINGHDCVIPGLAYDGERHHLPEKVAEWAGLVRFDDWEDEDVPDQDPTVRIDNNYKALSELNDAGSTFAEIADLIEEHL